MIPPSFSDLGSKARDLFNSNFKFGLISLDYASKSPQNVELSVKGNHDLKGGKLSGSVESSYKFDSGLKNVVKWDTKKTLSSDLSIEDFLLMGSKMSGNMSFQPDTGMKSFSAQSSYERNYINLGLDLDFPNIKPVLTPSLVLGCTGQKGFIAGVQVTYNTDRMSLVRHKFALGYQNEELTLMGTLVNKTEIEALVYQKVNPQVELGVNVKWNFNSRDTAFGIAGKYSFYETSFVKGKISSTSMLGLVYGFKARDDVKVSLSAEIDAKDLDKGSHRFGVGLSYAP